VVSRRRYGEAFGCFPRKQRPSDCPSCDGNHVAAGDDRTDADIARGARTESIAVADDLPRGLSACFHFPATSDFPAANNLPASHDVPSHDVPTHNLPAADYDDHGPRGRRSRILRMSLYGDP